LSVFLPAFLITFGPFTIIKENNNPLIVKVAHEYELFFMNITSQEYYTLKRIGIESEL
jgi:hypothetical protein